MGRNGRRRQRRTRGTLGRSAPFLLLILAMVIPVAPLVARGMFSVVATLQTVLQAEGLFFGLALVVSIPRIIGSVWVYFKVDNTWGNEVAYMAMFLISPLLGIILYMVTEKNRTQPPLGYEYATIKDGIVHQPVFEWVGPPRPYEAAHDQQPGQPPSPTGTPPPSPTGTPPPSPPPSPSPPPVAPGPTVSQGPTVPPDPTIPTVPPDPTIPTIPPDPTIPTDPTVLPSHEGPEADEGAIPVRPAVRPMYGMPPPAYAPPQPQYAPPPPQYAVPHPQYPQAPPQYPPQAPPQAPLQYPPQAPPQYPPQYPQYAPPPPQQPPPYAQYPPQGYPQQPQPVTQGYPPQQPGPYQMSPPSYPPSHGYPPPQQPHYGSGPTPTTPYGQPPRATDPGPGWKKVGVEKYQKRDFLSWHNPILLIIDAMFLAGYILFLFIAPLMGEIDVNDPESIETTFNAYFVLFSLIIQDGILIWMVWHQVVRRRVIPMSEMGLTRKQLADTPRVVKLTIAGLGLGLVLFTIASLIEMGQASLGFAPSGDDPVLGPGEGDIPGYLVWLISGCIIAPISEEFFFRGYAFYAYDRRYGLWVGIFVSSIGFAAIHTNIYALLPIFVAGVGFALAFWKTGSLIPPMVAHAVNNFIALTLMYMGFYG